ncbi:MAG: hypothetical protein WC307_02795 [Candidatus Nanoarchaeia archaeon]|jgi:hypothetical protein
MIFIALSIIDLLGSIIGLYTLISGNYLNILGLLMPLILIKGVWSVYSYPPGLIGWIDIIAPSLFYLSWFFSLSWTITYIALIVLMSKSIWGLMSRL